MPRFNRYCFVLALITLLASTTYGSRVQVHFSENTNEILFENDHVTCYIDNLAKSSVDEIKNKEFTFLNGPFTNKNIGSAYWLRFHLTSNSIKTKRWVLEIMDAHQQNVEVYMFRKDSLFYHTQTGQNVKNSKEIYSHKNHIVDLPIAANDSIDCYIRFRSNIIGSLLFKIRTNANFTSYAVKEYYLLGLYYGILGIICLLNLMLFARLKEKIYAIYVVYVISWILLSLIDDGIGTHLIWQNQLWLNEFGYFFSKPILIASYVWYTLIFFKNQTIKKKDKVVIVSSVLLICILTSLEFIFEINFGLTDLLVFIPLIFSLKIAFKTYDRGYLPARFFILGNIFILLGFLLRYMHEISIIRYVSEDSLTSILGVYSRNIGVVLEIITLTLALGDRFRFMKRENEQQQNKLLEEFNEKTKLQSELLLEFNEKEKLQSTLLLEFNEKEKLQTEIIEHLRENELLKDTVNRELESKVNLRTLELQAKSHELESLNLKLQKQANDINEMNRLLDLDNYKLKNEVKTVSSKRVLSKDITFEEFKLLYPDKLSVWRFLNTHKWKDGYACKKCGNTKYCDGNTKFSRRCTKCRYDESITVSTIFHKCKFPLEQAFYIVTKTIKLGNDVNIQLLSEELDLRKNTVWNYKTKVLEAVEANKKNKNNEDFIKTVILNPSPGD